MTKQFSVIAALLASFGAASGSTIVSTFSSTPPGYGRGFAYEVSNVPWAMGFTVPTGTDFQFTGFIVPLTDKVAPTTATFTLASDNGGVPGAAIEKITITVSDGIALYTGDSILDPTLIAGDSYWLEASVPKTNGSYPDWNAANVSYWDGLGPVADYDPVTRKWFANPNDEAAFEIDGTAVPEPAHLSLVLAGFAVLLGFSKLSRSSIL